MTCDEVRQHWDLYHDSEGDSELHFQINEHLGECPGCAKWFAQQSRLENLLAEKLASQTASPELWSSVLEKSQVRPVSSARRWIWLMAMAASILIAVALGSWILFRDTAETDTDLARHLAQSDTDLAPQSANLHEKLIGGKVEVAFASTSDLKVEDYLRKKVTFPVRCPPRKDAGFAVHGAGICKFGKQPVAYLLGRVDNAPVSIFVLAKNSLPFFPDVKAGLSQKKTLHSRQGSFQMALAVIDKNIVVVIGETSSQNLERVLKAYGTYPHSKNEGRG